MTLNRKRKVAIVIPALSTGGAEKLVYEIACNIDKDKYEVTVISLHPSNGGLREQTLLSEDVKLIYLDKKPGLSFACFYKMIKVIRRIKPDVIHSHLDVLLYLLPCFRRNQVKLHTVHSVAEFEAKGIQRLIRKISFGVFKVKPIAIGNIVQNSIVDYYNLSKEEVVCVYNGVKLPDKQECRCGNDVVSFITVGTLYYVKNHELLFHAFKRCLEKTTKDIRLKIVGEGELKADLIELSKKLQIYDKVDFLGWRDDVYSELQASDIYVCSSIVEGISLSIIEAMACGLPIIASNVGGNIELVCNKVNGSIYENNNCDELSKCMLTLIEDEEMRNEQGAKSLKFSLQYDINRCVKEYERLYM